MDNKLPIKKLVICASTAVTAAVLGILDLRLPGESAFAIIREVLLSIIAAAGMTAIGEFFASLSKFPIISYVASAVMCAITLQAITSWNKFITWVDPAQPDKFVSIYHEIVMSCLVVYLISLTVSILFGIFVLHRKNISQNNS